MIVSLKNINKNLTEYSLDQFEIIVPLFYWFGIEMPVGPGVLSNLTIILLLNVYLFRFLFGIIFFLCGNIFLLIVNPYYFLHDKFRRISRKNKKKVQNSWIEYLRIDKFVKNTLIPFISFFKNIFSWLFNFVFICPIACLLFVKFGQSDIVYDSPTVGNIWWKIFLQSNWIYILIAAFLLRQILMIFVKMYIPRSPISHQKIYRCLLMFLTLILTPFTFSVIAVIGRYIQGNEYLWQSLFLGDFRRSLSIEQRENIWDIVIDALKIKLKKDVTYNKKEEVFLDYCKNMKDNLLNSFDRGSKYATDYISNNLEQFYDSIPIEPEKTDALSALAANSQKNFLENCSAFIKYMFTDSDFMIQHWIILVCILLGGNICYINREIICNTIYRFLCSINYMENSQQAGVAGLAGALIWIPGMLLFYDAIGYKINNLGTKIENFGTKITAFEEKMENDTVKDINLETKIVNLDTKIESLNAKIINLDTKIANLYITPKKSNC